VAVVRVLTAWAAGLGSSEVVAYDLALLYADRTELHQPWFKSVEDFVEAI
jgi:hypothetical protein